MKRIFTILLCILSVVGTTDFSFAENTNQSLLSFFDESIYLNEIVNNGSIGDNFDLSDISELIVSCSSTNVSCSGASNGTVSSSASGGVLPYSYQWSNNASTNSISGLIAGTYTVTVTDANGSTIATSCIVGTNNGLQIVCTSTPASCDTLSTPCSGTTLVIWDLANCGASYSDYSEFTPAYPNNGNCGTVNASIVSRNSGNHSCNIGRPGGDGIGFCVDGFNSNTYVSNASNAIRFSVNFGAGDVGKLSELNFWETSTNPTFFLNSTTPVNNNYPTKYGVRVLKNGTQIYLQTGNNTTTAYSLESFDFSGLSDFEYNGATVFEFELYAYLPVGNSHSNYIWDIDDISVEGCCGSSTNPPTIPPTSCACNGKMKELTVQYQGVNGANIEVKTHQGVLLTSYNNVQTNQSLTLNAQNIGLNNLGPKTFWHVNSGSGDEIHTSCSQPIINLTFGDFLVTGYIDGSNNVCGPTIPPPPTPPTSFLCDGTISCTVTGGSGQYSYSWTSNVGPVSTTTSTSPTPVTGFNSSILDSLCPGVYCLVVTDLVSGCVDSTCITIAVPDCSPIAVDDNVTIVIGDTVDIQVLLNDTFPNNNIDTSSLQVLSGPNNGTATVNTSTGIITYIPDSTFIGIDSFVYVICNTAQLCDSATVYITVDSIPSLLAPIAVNDSATVNQGSSVGISVLLNDSFPPNNNVDISSLMVISGPSSGTAAVDSITGIITYIPNPNFYGLDSFTYIVCNTMPLCDMATVYITVDSTTNQLPPIVLNDSATVNQGSSVGISVLLNDTFPNNNIDTSSLQVLSGPNNGTAIVNTSTGIITYIPDSTFIGIDSFVYVICNTAQLCDSATVYITVDSIPSLLAPIAVNDSATVNQGSSVGISVLLNDSFPPNNNVDISSLMVISGPSSGTAAVDSITGIITYIPNPNFYGLDSFTYIVCNTMPLCDMATVYITVDSTTNQLPPIVLNDSATVNQGSSVGISVLLNDTFPNNNIDTSSLQVLSGPNNGTATVNTSTGIITYIPDSTFIGIDSFVYVICNTAQLCDSATVYITVDSIPSLLAPIAVNDSATVNQGSSVGISVLLNDSFPPNNNVDISSLMVISGPSSGTAAVDSITGIITYIPNPNFYGLDSFTYIVCNTIPLCDMATVYITVDSTTNQLPPIAVNDSATVNQGSGVGVSVLLNDSFPPNNNVDISSLMVISGPSSGTAAVDSLTGIVTYIANPNYYGLDSFTYVICNTIPLCDMATVYITVDSTTNQLLPIAVDDSATVTLGSSVGVSVLLNDSFPPNNNVDISSLMVISGPSSGTTAVDTITGIVTYIPNPNFYGLDSFTYVICNTIPLCDMATVYITVDSTNNQHPPIAVNDSVTINQGSSVGISVLLNDSFPPNNNVDISSLMVISGPSGGTAAVDTITGIVTYIPNPNFVGLDSFTYVICNTIPLCDMATVYITVNGPCPVANAGADQNLCNVTTTTLAGSALGLGQVGNWSVISGTAIVSNPGSPTSGVMGLTTGSSILVWTVTSSSGTCVPSSDTMVIVLNTITIITTADAGPDQILCNVTTTTLAANSAAICESGTWSIIAGTGIAINPNSPTSGVIGLSIGVTSQFIWTITGSSGNFSSDTMSITVNAIANAGPNQNLCNTSTSTLSAIAPGPSESGIWTVLAGTAIVTNPGSATSGVTNLTIGASSTLIWTITGICGTSSDNVVINVGTTSIANAGSDKNICDSTIANLSGNMPAVGDTGTWSVINGTAIVTNPNSPTSGVTNLTIGASSTLVWTITGPCGSNSDTLVINVQSAASITQSNAGPDQTLCNVTTTLLAANTPGLLESGSWTVLSGTAQVTSTSSSTSGVTGLTIGSSSTLVWTITGLCGTTTDTMLIAINAIANAGPDQNLCNTSTTTLSAIAPGPSENGIWTVLSGTAIVTNPGSATSGVTNLTLGTSSTLIWTITGICGTSSDNVVINIGTTPGVNAGSDKNLCDSTIANLSGSIPAVGDTGTWSVINGTAIVTNPNSPTSAVFNLTIGASSTLVWTITGPCGSNADTLVINVQSASSITQANAGPDQIICNVTTTLLAANTPGLLESGSWTVISGTAQVTSTSSSTSGVTGLTIGASSTLVWAITGLCGTTTDTMLIAVNAIANAGPDQNLCNTSTTTLSATAPGPSENGIWTVLSGTAIVTNPGSATSGVTNLTLGTSSTLIWTITGICGTSSDNVVINIGTTPGVNAGSDKNLCDSTSTTLSGNLPAVGDTGTWTVINGTAVISNPNSPTSGVFNLTIGASSTLVWTITGPCGSNSDTLLINVQSSASITQADAGLDQDLCDTITTTSLNANAPGAGENGTWTVIAGTAIVTNPNVPTSGVTGLTLGSSTLVWTISNACAGSSDTLFLNVTTGGNCCINLPLTAVDDIANPDEDTPITIFVLANDVDPESKIDASSLKVIVQPDSGSITAINTILGTITYQPEINYFGVDSFTYVVCDTGCLVVNCDTAIVRIFINSKPDCPIAEVDSATTEKNTAVNVDVAANDTDVDGNLDLTSVTIITFPIHGNASVNNVTGEILYDPDFGFLGSDSLVYEICDDGIPICCDTAIVYIKVEGDCDVCVPQCLSPNGDLIDDVLEIKCIENYPNNELVIFNRWGNCVYEMKNYDNTWDGSSNTDRILYGDELHDGTYFYVFDKGDGSKPMNGFLVLKRK